MSKAKILAFGAVLAALSLSQASAETPDFTSVGFDGATSDPAVVVSPDTEKMVLNEGLEENLGEVNVIEITEPNPEELELPGTDVFIDPDKGIETPDLSYYDFIPLPDQPELQLDFGIEVTSETTDIEDINVALDPTIFDLLPLGDGTLPGDFDLAYTTDFTPVFEKGSDNILWAFSAAPSGAVFTLNSFNSVAVVPEPSTYALLGLGGLILLVASRKKRLSAL